MKGKVIMKESYILNQARQILYDLDCSEYDLCDGCRFYGPGGPAGGRCQIVIAILLIFVVTITMVLVGLVTLLDIFLDEVNQKLERKKKDLNNNIYLIKYELYRKELEK